MSQRTEVISLLKTATNPSSPSQVAVGTTAAQILAANPSSKRVIVQNTGITTIKLVLGTGTPTQTDYHVALAPGTAADDGKGGSYIDELWTGAIQAISSGAGGTLVLLEMT